MRECPKCSAKYEGDAKICRTCGGILQECVEPTCSDELPPGVVMACVVPTDDSLPETACTKRHSWTCPRCNQQVPEPFDLCWSCQASRDESAVAVADNQPGNADAAPAEFKHSERPPAELRCARCGSSRVIPGVTICDQGQGSNLRLQVVVCGDPEAVFFKDRLYKKMTADVCGDCGHAELKIEGARELYEHYRRSRLTHPSR